MHRHLIKWPALSLVFCFATYVSAQSTSPTQNPTPSGQSASQSGQSPTAHNNVLPYDRDQQDRSNDREELARFHQFLDSHREISEQLRKDPSLADNAQFLKNHPALQTYLQDHPEVRQQLHQDPNAFMHQEDRYDHGQDAMNRNDYDRDRRELASFNQFLDSHREISEQLRKDPSLADNAQFLKNHPALQTYLQDHPEVRQQLHQDPNAFMHQEDRYDHGQDAMNRGADFDRANAYDRDHDANHDAQRRFGEFLGSHSDLNQQLAKNPSLCKDPQFMQDHPEFQDYLNSHPDVRAQLMADPDNFLKSTQQWNNAPGTKTTTQPPAAPTSAPTTSTPKPKQ